MADGLRKEVLHSKMMFHGIEGVHATGSSEFGDGGRERVIVYDIFVCGSMSISVKRKDIVCDRDGGSRASEKNRQKSPFMYVSLSRVSRGSLDKWHFS
jgi:hypothetical protein